MLQDKLVKLYHVVHVNLGEDYSQLMLVYESIQGVCSSIDYFIRLVARDISELKRQTKRNVKAIYNPHVSFTLTIFKTYDRHTIPCIIKNS